MTGLVIPPQVIANQIAASDPATSAWVSANAGSGKTHVLSQRVIRLLLSGVDPSKILCLTFTKAAAGNMANRVLSTLSGWTALDDAALAQKIQVMEDKAPSADRLLRARRLFAQALETPGGLKVQTIHAFCTSLLHQFPFEADVAAAFEVFDEREENETIDRLRLDVLLQAAAAPETPLGRALATAIATSADTTFADVVREAIGQRAVIEGWIARAGGLETALAELSRALGVSPEQSVEAIEAEFFGNPVIARLEWASLRDVFAQGSTNDQKHITRLDRALAGEGLEHIEAWIDIFCNGDRAPRKAILTKKLAAAHPALAQQLSEEQSRLCALLDRRRAVAVRDRSAALITVADAVLRRYREDKNRRGRLDYEDLIEKTLALLDKDAAAWVHYKLDLGIDHVLIDEAQDTSPKQWAVIEKLTDEFTAGEGARSHIRRSMFAVGDEKQSIYSFQGAAPHRFDEMRRQYERKHHAAGVAFAPIPMHFSFRSTIDVLGAVDKVFERPESHAGLGAESIAPSHAAVRQNVPGLVEFWNLEKPADKEEVAAWDAPFDTTSEHSPRARLARRIALHVCDLIARGERIEDRGVWRAVTPGDVLVLVRQRGALFEAIIRALKDVGVEVAGADRLVLGEHIAVMDLVSLADALLLPEDDLALAEALKSPLFGFDDDALFAIAHARRGSLRAALRAKAGEHALFAGANERLDRLAAAARTQSPFAFYADLLGAGGGRRALVRRLGPEANDALDEFLTLALDFERRHVPSLQGFVDWLRKLNAEVKRDMDIVRNEVRVMTVHGAKGLEAPVVILADTTTRPEGSYAPRLLKLGTGDDRDAPAPMVWATSGKEDNAPVADARKRAISAAQEEYRRLLYVAMTRAADRLIVCGAQGHTKIPDGCWYDLVRSALEPDAQKIGGEGEEPAVWRWRLSTGAAPEGPASPSAEAAREDAVAQPAWLTRSAPQASGSEVGLAPSRAAEAPHGGSGRIAPTAEVRAALRRGVRVHRLLQALPDVPTHKRGETAHAFLARPPEPAEPDEAAQIVAQVMAVLNHQSFAPLFALGTRAEAPVVGRLERADGPPLRVSGTIDRLAVMADAVLIADFKTDRSPAASPDEVPDGYVTQLALYRAVISKLYPDRSVRAALIYTETAALVEIPGTALDAALARLGVRAS